MTRPNFSAPVTISLLFVLELYTTLQMSRLSAVLRTNLDAYWPDSRDSVRFGWKIFGDITQGKMGLLNCYNDMYLAKVLG